MNDEIINEPKIRFRGYTEEWEQRKLGALGNFKNGMNFGKDAMGHGSPFVNLQNIFGRNIVDNTTLELAASTDKQKADYSLEKGDVLFIRSSVKPSGVGEATLVDKDLPNTTYSGFIIRFRSEIDMDDNFKRYVFGSKQVRNQIMARATSSANTNINQDSLALIQVGLPSIKEQKQIGAFFASLDNTITLHQRELDLLKQIKKSYLQKMFPKNSEDKPEIRFGGFTDVWQQCKLGEIFNERTERSAEGELISVTINSGVVKASDLERKDSSSSNKSNYKIVKKGDIAYNSMRMWQGANGFSPYTGILSPAYTVISPKENIDSMFMSYMFKKYDMIQIFKRNSQGLTSDTWNLKFPTLSTIKVRIPSIDEQEEIANLFKQIDNTITIHQGELDSLKEMKKSLLQQMFA